LRWLKCRNPGAVRSDLALNRGRRERNFWMQRRSAKNRHSNARTPAETKIQELSGRKSPQKRPIWRRIGNVRFAETGWWCAQSYANRSPCYLANIRVIFQKNSEPPALNARTRCGTAAFELFQNLDNRKKQGGRPRLTASGPGSTDSGSRSLDCWGWGPIREAAESEKSCQERQ